VRNEFTHVAWERTPFPSEKPGTYLVRTSSPLQGKSCYGLAVVSQIANGYLTTIGGLFEWDAIHGGNRIIAWAELDDSHAPEREI